MKSRAGFALAGTIAVFVGSCFEPLDTKRETQPGSFGHIVLDLACQRIAYLSDLEDGGKVDVRNDRYRDMCRALDPIPAAPGDAPVALKALQAKRPELEQAVDAIFPDGFLADLQAFLSSNEFLSTYDDDTGIQAIDALIGTLRLFADDPEAIAALERLNVRTGYRPIKPALGVVRAVVNYPEMHDLLLTLTEAITPGGSARGEWENLVAAVGATLRDAAPVEAPNEPDRVGRLALDLLLSERSLLGTSKSIELVKRDQRGLALVSTVAAPFVDTSPADGLADVDATGQLICNGCVDVNKDPIEAPSPFALPPGDEIGVWQFRDTQGRPKADAAASSRLLYQYVDLDKTMLSALARDGIQLFDPQKGTALNLLRGSSALMGGRVEATKTFDSGETLTYRGYDLSQSALLDMLYGFLQVLRDPAIYDTLGLGKKLLTEREAEVARLAEQVVLAARKADLHPEATISAAAPLWDDLMPIIQAIAAKDRNLDTDANASTNSLMADLVRALEKPAVKGLSAHFRNYLLNRDAFPFNTNFTPRNGEREFDYPLTGSFSTPVDRAQPDSAGNRSIMERLLYLIANSNGAKMCNKPGGVLKDPFVGITLRTYAECELVNVPNLAVLYVQSIAFAKNAQGQIICERDGGAFDNNTSAAATPQSCPSGTRPRPKADFKYNWGKTLLLVEISGIIGGFGGDKFLEDTIGLTGFRTHPTPAALNRVLAMDSGDDCAAKMPTFLSDLVDSARDKFKDKFCVRHPDILQVWEKDKFYEALQPVVQAFADHGAEQQFVDILTVLHKHWPSARSVNHQTTNPSASGYVYGTGAMVYEPLIADMLAGGGLLDALVDTAPAINATTVNGKAAPAVLAAAASFLVTPQAGLADRQGKTKSKTADGKEVPQLSPWQILADAYALKQQRMAAAGAEGSAWAESVSQLIDVLVRGAEVPGQGWKFKNPRMRGISVALLDFVEGRLRAHDAAGARVNRVAWVSQKLPTDLKDALTHPVYAGAADFVLSLQAAPDTRRHLEGLVQYLVDEVTYDEAFTASLTSMADVLQLALSDADIVPLAHVAGEAMRSERGWVEKQLTFFKRARQADKNAALVQIMRNLYSEHRTGHTAIGDLVDGISEVLRSEPYEKIDAPYKADDFRSLLLGIASFLDDEHRGLRKFIAIVKHRNLEARP